MSCCRQRPPGISGPDFSLHLHRACRPSPDSSQVDAAVAAALVAAAAEEQTPVSTLEELPRACAKLSEGSAPGNDQLPYQLFKVSCPQWSSALLAFFNLLLRWGVVPSQWKIACVVLLQKGGDPRAFGNWRPISLLSCFGKLYERLLLARLAPLLDPGLSSAQAGFRFGPDEQAWLLCEAVRLRLLGADQSGPPRAALPRAPARRLFVAFVDVRKAFDCVWRSGLLHKLRSRGCSGKLLLACAALLDRTSSAVRLPSGLSAPWDDVRGVRQGAILSPLEFLVFIDDLAADLAAVCPGVRFQNESGLVSVSNLLYADDIAILATSAPELQAALEVLDAWAARWQLCFGFGPEKTAVLCFGGGPSSGMSPFVLSGRSLEYVSSYRYLGIVLDRNLSFKEHCKHLCQNVLRKFCCQLWLGPA